MSLHTNTLRSSCSISPTHDSLGRENSQPFFPSGDGTELNSHCNRFYNLAFRLSFKLCRSRYPMSLTQQATFSSDGTSELKGAHIALDQVEPLPLSRLLLVPSLQFSATLQSLSGVLRKRLPLLVVHHLALQFVFQDIKFICRVLRCVYHQYLHPAAESQAHPLCTCVFLFLSPRG